MKSKKKATSITLQDIIDQSDALAIHALAMKGVSYHYINEISKNYELDLVQLATMIGIYELDNPEKTNNKRKKHLIKGIQAEYLIKLDLLFKLGLLVFRTPSELKQWLSFPFKLSSIKASEYLYTNSGIDLLMQELHAIGLGYPV